MLQTLTYKANVAPEGVPPVIRLSQNENGRVLVFDLVGTGTVNIPAGSVVTISGTKPDGVVYSAEGTLDGTSATFDEDTQMTAVSGEWPAKLRVTYDGETIASVKIWFAIDADPVRPGSVPSESELNGLVAEAQQYAESARSAAYGSPLTANTAADMTNTDKVYVYTGSESGYLYGHWYYYDGSAWQDGGVYQSQGVQTDTTLTEAGVPADAKATGDRLTAAETDIDGLETDVSDLKEDLDLKADPDGTYPDMTVGTAQQLETDQYTEDSEPYHFRKSGGGSVRVGEREIDKIVGGTIAWNQRIRTRTESGATVSRNGVDITIKPDGSIVMNGTATDNFWLAAVSSLIPIVVMENTAGHVVLFLYRSTHSFYNRQIGTANNGYLVYENNAVVTKRIASANEQNTAVQIQIASGDVFSNDVVYPCMYDLTAAFGTTIADYIYSLEQSTAGAGVAWVRRYIDLDTYHPFDAGTLKSVEGLVSHDMVGFNQWDEEWEVGALSSGIPTTANNAIRSKNFCKCIGGATYFMTCGKTDGGSNNRYYIAVVFYDANKTYINNIYMNNGTAIAPENAAYFKVTTNTSTVIYGNIYNHDICINLSDPAKNGTYEPYEKHSYPLDSTVKLNGVFKLVDGKLVADGDEYSADGPVRRRYRLVTFNGTEAWGKESATWNSNGLNVYYISINNPDTIAKLDGTTVIPNLCCNKFVPASTAALKTADTTGWIGLIGGLGNGTYIEILHDATDLNSFKTWLASNPTTVSYELATPTTEEATPFTSPQWVDGSGTEQYVSTSLVPIGHYTQYPEDLVGKLEGLPWDFANLIAPTEASYKATQAYSTGALFIVNNILYKATTSIASGAMITPNTNCTQTTLAAVIAAL